MKGRILKPTTDAVYYAFNHVKGGSSLSISNDTGADLTVEVTNENAQKKGVNGVTWADPAQGFITIPDGDNALLYGPYAFVKLSGAGTGAIYAAYVEKDEPEALNIYNIPGGATFYAGFNTETYFIDGEIVTFDLALDITRASSKYVWQPVNGQMQLVEIPAGEPAFAYDPVTGKALGLSVEGSAANLLLHSSNFADTAWSKTESLAVSQSAEVAPDGSTDAYLIEDVSATSYGSISQLKSIAAGTYTASIYIRKPESSHFIAFQLQSSGAVSEPVLYIDVFDGTVNKQSELDSYKYEEVANGWVRLSITATFASATTRGVFIVPAIKNDAGNIPTSSATGGVIVWGAQLEQGTKPTSYIPTTTSTATRDADIVTSDSATFGDWFNASEGTFVVEFEYSGDTSKFPRIFSEAEVSNLSLYIQTNVDVIFDTRVIGGIGSSVVGTAIVGRNIIEISYSNTELKTSLNGEAAVSHAVTSSFGAQISVPGIRLGSRPAGNFLDGTVKLLSFKPEATL